MLKTTWPGRGKVPVPLRLMLPPFTPNVKDSAPCAAAAKVGANRTFTVHEDWGPTLAPQVPAEGLKLKAESPLTEKAKGAPDCALLFEKVTARSEDAPVTTLPKAKLVLSAVSSALVGADAVTAATGVTPGV